MPRLPQAHVRALIALALALATAAMASPALALQIQIDGIVAAPGTSYAPNARLGLTTAMLGTAALKRVVNYADCKEIAASDAPRVRITWSWTDKTLSLSEPRYGVKLAPPGATCDGNSMTESTATSGCKILVADKSFASPLTAKGEITDIDLSVLLGKPDCAVAQEVEGRVYFVITDSATGTAQTSSLTMNVALDTAPPAPPTIETLAAGGENLRVTWSKVDEATTPHARVYWSKVAFPALAPSTATSRSDKLTGTSYQITELDNGTTYYVAVTAIDDNDNESAANEVREGVPVEVQDFWQYYKASGGASDAGYAGCSAAGPAGAGGSPGGSAVALLVLLALAVLAWHRRGSRRRPAPGTTLAMMLAVATSLAAAPAQADSPRTASLDLRFGYYTPGIDTEFRSTNGQTPYGTIFGDAALHKGLSLEQIVWDGFGDLSVGFSAGWWSATGKSRAMDGTSARDKTELLMVPLSLDVSYRFNVLAFRYGFPLVPYVKGGISYTLWWGFDGNDKVSTYTDASNRVTSAQGGVAGFYGTVGARLLLDVFEPKAARGMDLELGVNHSYLFVEYQALSINNFGDARALDLSDNVILFGLGLDL